MLDDGETLLNDNDDGLLEMLGLELLDDGEELSRQYHGVPGTWLEGAPLDGEPAGELINDADAIDDADAGDTSLLAGNMLDEDDALSIQYHGVPGTWLEGAPLDGNGAPLDGDAGDGEPSGELIDDAGDTSLLAGNMLDEDRFKQYHGVPGSDGADKLLSPDAADGELDSGELDGIWLLEDTLNSDEDD